MSIKVLTQALCKSKSTNHGTNPKTGEDVTWYNLELVDPKNYDRQVVGVPEDVFNKVEEGKTVKLIGEVGGLKTKYWRFTALSE